MTKSIPFGRWMAAAMVVGLLGCGDAVLAEDDEIVYLSPWSTQSVQPERIEDIPPAVAPNEERNYREVREQFTAQASGLLERPDVVEQLEGIEQIFMVSGGYLELVRIYEDHVEEVGVDTVAAPALAWAYLQLGQERQARQLIERLKAERSEEALTWVMVGMNHLQYADQSLEHARAAKEALERALEIEPNFGGFKGFTAQAISTQIEQLGRRIPAEAEASVAAETTEQETQELEGDLIGVEVNREESSPDQQERASHRVARGQADLQRGSDHLESAQSHFRRALELEPGNLDAGIGLLTVASRSGAPEEMLAAQVDRIADAEELTARQAYEMGLFCLRTLNDRDRATSLLNRVRQMDPSFSERVGVDALLAQ